MSLNSEAIKRIAKDVKYIINNENSLSLENIYYKHDEENVFKGYGLIIGNEDTPYGYGYYFFEFNFPDNYPYSPPNVRYLTNDGTMRFNPNLYTNGKVCLSILNTWSGESWTSCQSINSILLTLSTILCKDPLKNEPGIQKSHADFEKYNYLVTYKNIEFSIFKILELVNNYDKNNLIKNNEIEKNETKNKIVNKKNYHDIGIMYKFQSIINKNFEKNKQNIINYISKNKVKYKYFVNKEKEVQEKNVNKILNNSSTTNKLTLYISIYNLSYSLNFNKIENFLTQNN